MYEEKIYGLIVQAQEMQKYALEFQGSAEDALKTLPEATREAVRDATKEFVTEGLEKASKGILEASRVATDVTEELRTAQNAILLRHVLLLVLAAMVLSVGIYSGLGFLVNQRADDLADLTARAQSMQSTVNKLNNDYGKALFSTCSGRPCVRVDEKLGRFGEVKQGEVYMVLYGY